jgi:hypothetical protein
MRHAVLLGGKRMRPLLVYAAGTAFGAAAETLDAPAAAVECIHAYSLVHDDLPAMDDDALRRGQPTVHVAFDEATAILAGDALQTLAFETLAQAPLATDVRVALLAELANASGVRGMCGGQALDIDATGKADATSLDALQQLHAMKTGALLRASVRMGAIVTGADADTRQRLDTFADALGLAPCLTYSINAKPDYTWIGPQGQTIKGCQYIGKCGPNNLFSVYNDPDVVPCCKCRDFCLQNIDSDGEWTGWNPKRIGIGPETTIVVSASELLTMFGKY